MLRIYICVLLAASLPIVQSSMQFSPSTRRYVRNTVELNGVEVPNHLTSELLARAEQRRPIAELQQAASTSASVAVLQGNGRAAGASSTSGSISTADIVHIDYDVTLVEEFVSLDVLDNLSVSCLMPGSGRGSRSHSKSEDIYQAARAAGQG